MTTRIETPTEGAGLVPSGPSPVVARHPGRRWWPFGLGLTIVLIGLSLVIPGGRHEWALAIIRQPTDYTSLSFQDPAGVPDALSPGGSISLPFTITNDEGRPMRYAYVVTSASSGQIGTVLLRGTVQVPTGGHRLVPVSLRPVCAASPCIVDIALPGDSETIDALVNLPTPHL